VVEDENMKTQYLEYLTLSDEVKQEVKDSLKNDKSREVAYWRKANHIHNWFVENVQGGVDNCEPFEVTKDKLQELLNLCQLVYTNKDKAKELMPTSGGFFF